MKRLITCFALAGIMLLCASPVLADGNARAGAKKATTCFACHGKNGESVSPTYPRLAGQHQNYLEQALHEYQSGQRSNPIMQGFARQLSEKDIADITAYYASLPGTLQSLKGHVQGDGG